MFIPFALTVCISCAVSAQENPDYVIQATNVTTGNNLPGLMGISNGTYIGLKKPEDNKNKSQKMTAKFNITDKMPI